MIQDAPPGSYNLYFTQNLGEAFGDYQTPLLTDIPLGSVVVPPAPDPNPDLATAALVYPMIENAGMYGNAVVAGYNGAVNRYAGGAYDAAGRVPMPLLSGLFARFGSLSGWTFTGNFLANADLKWLLLYNLTSLDSQASIVYQNHLPELSFPDLLKALRQLFNLYLDFDVRRNSYKAVLGADEKIIPAELELWKI